MCACEESCLRDTDSASPLLSPRGSSLSSPPSPAYLGPVYRHRGVSEKMCVLDFPSPGFNSCLGISPAV